MNCWLVCLMIGAGVSWTVGACDGRVPLVPGSGAGTGGAAPASSNWNGNGGTGVGGTAGAVVDPHGIGGAEGGGTIVPPADAGAATGAKSCAQLEADYVAAVDAAKACDPTSSVPQCTKVVIPALCVGGCSTMVNDTALPYAVRIAWDAVPCPVHPTCGAPSSSPCPATHAARCVPTASGGGHCVDVGP
jgi:hypothetical protein